jgi:hypothetical protein
MTRPTMAVRRSRLVAEDEDAADDRGEAGGHGANPARIQRAR